MNTPTPRTDAATYPADCLGATLVTNRDCARELERELTAELEKVRVLRSALESLCDEQNGAPLSTREEEWKQAMDGAEAALAATEEIE